jgi:hypothetical protein
VHVDAGRHLARKVTLQVFGQSAGVLDVLEAPREFTERVGVVLPCFDVMSAASSSAW